MDRSDLQKFRCVAGNAASVAADETFFAKSDAGAKMIARKRWQNLRLHLGIIAVKRVDIYRWDEAGGDWAAKAFHSIEEPRRHKARTK